MLTTHEDILPLSIRARDGGAYRGMNETTTVFQIIFDDASVIFSAMRRNPTARRL